MMKIDHNALPQPDRSELRKMSANIAINIQIQMKNKKNQSIDQNTWPVPNSASNTTNNSLGFDWGVCGQTRVQGGSTRSAAMACRRSGAARSTRLTHSPRVRL